MFSLKCPVHKQSAKNSMGNDRLRTVLDNTVDGIITIDAHGMITTVNPACERIFGYASVELVGQNVNMLMPEEYRREHDTYIQNYHQTRQAKVIGIGREVRGRRKDGSEFPLDLSVGEVADEAGVSTFVGIVRDISERKRAEESLREYTERLKRSNQDLDDFVYIVSHDLKEPLRGIYSYAQFLEEDYADKLDDDGKQKLETLKVLSHRMSELIDSLLEYSRLGRTQLSFTEVDMNDVVESSLEFLSTFIREEDAKVTIVDRLPKVMCDHVRIGEVFTNLIANGIKYNDSMDKRIEVGVTDDGAGKPVLYVRDNGIGIPEKFHESIFKMFKRLHGRDAYGGGTGSGLAIVKKIIDRHGGKIWLRSGDDNGTTFYFTLQP